MHLYLAFSETQIILSNVKRTNQDCHGQLFVAFTKPAQSLLLDWNQTIHILSLLIMY
jgi:hypothetical protein